MSNFPNALDTDSTIPAVIDGATELSSETINSMISAILAIEGAIGVDPQGSLSTLVQRISVSLNADGTLKGSALLAAGLLALPITNTQIGASAAISESKLDLTYSTQSLYNSIVSNDIDIATLQEAMLDLIADFSAHVTGNDFQHDGFSILLDNANPGTPPWLTGFTASTVSDALSEIVAAYSMHTNANTVGAHLAKNIAVSQLQTISATNVQTALEALEEYRAQELVEHRDDLHANGISAWENSTTGWNPNLQRVPVSGVTSAVAISATVLDFTPSLMTGVVVGDVAVIDGYGFTVTRVGPLLGVGALPSLTNTQVEVLGGLAFGASYSVAIFGKSSVSNLRTALATTAIPGASTADTVMFARPNAAKLVSLGLYPTLVGASDSISVTAGVGATSRSVTITNLHKDRTGVGSVAEVTVRTIADRINYVVASAVVGNAIPFAAYAIGSELALAHNWSDSALYTIEITAAAGEIERAFDNAGSLSQSVAPSVSNHFWVDGVEHQDFRTLVSSSAVGSGATFSFSGVDLLDAGVTVGQMLHVTASNVAAEIGSYQITALSSTVVGIGQSLTGTAVSARVDASTIGLTDFNGATDALLVELFVNRDGRTGRSLRARYADSVPGVKITSTSDSLSAGAHTLLVQASGSDRLLRFTSNLSQAPITVDTAFIGTLKLYAATNVDWIEVKTNGAIGAGSAVVTVYSHVDEEDLLELSTIRVDGQVVDSIGDRRLFGSIGLDEIREDVVQAYFETPLAELRGDGAVRGFGILTDNIDLSVQGYSAGTRGVLLDGGIAYIDGVRVVQSTQYVPVPPVNGTYVVGITTDATYRIIDTATYTLSQIIEGRAGSILPLFQSVRTGTPAIATTSLVTYISNLDSRVDAVLDLTNNFTGSFSTVSAAVAYLNAYPNNEKRKLRVVSSDTSSLNLDALTAELDLQIEGSVSSISSNKSIKISGFLSESRTALHATTVNISGSYAELENLILETVTIDPSLAVSGEYIFRNCRFVDAVINCADPTGLVSRIVFEDCTFTGTSVFIDAQSDVTGSCRFVLKNVVSDVAGSITLAGADAKFIECEFSQTAIDWLGTDGSYVSISDTDFINYTLGAGESIYSSPLGTTVMQNVYVDALTITATASAFDLAPLHYSSVSGLACRNLNVTHSTASATAILISSSVLSSVDNVQIDGVSSANAPMILAGDVSYVSYDEQGSAIIRIDASRISECKNARMARPYPAVVGLTCTDTKFVGSAIAPCLVWGSSLRVFDTTFDLTIAGIGIGAADATSRVDIFLSGLSFSAGSGNSLDFNSIASLNAYVVNCTFGTGTITNSAQLSDIKFSGCTFSIASQIQAGSGCSFSDCTIVNQLTIAGGATDLILNNNRGPIGVYSGSTGTICSGNIGTITWGGTHTDAQITTNRGNMLPNIGAIFVSSSLISNRHGTSTGLASIEFQNCIIEGNSYEATLVTFTDPTFSSISNCVFAEDVTIASAAGIPDYVFFSNCRSLTPSDLLISDGVTNSVFLDNAGFTISSTGPISGTVFNLNTNGSLTLSGSLLSCEILSNKLGSMTLSGATIQGVILTSNIVAGTATIGGSATSSCTNVILSDLMADTLTVGASPGGLNAIYDNIVVSNVIATTAVSAMTNINNASGFDLTATDISFNNVIAPILDLYTLDTPGGVWTKSMYVNSCNFGDIEFKTLSGELQVLRTAKIFISNTQYGFVTYPVSTAQTKIVRASNGARVTSGVLTTDTILSAELHKGEYTFELFVYIDPADGNAEIALVVDSGTMDTIFIHRAVGGTEGSFVGAGVSTTAATTIAVVTANPIRYAVGKVTILADCNFSLQMRNTGGGAVVMAGSHLKVEPINYTG
jgi:hypothetical protein